MASKSKFRAPYRNPSSQTIQWIADHTQHLEEKMLLSADNILVGETQNDALPDVEDGRSGTSGLSVYSSLTAAPTAATTTWPPQASCAATVIGDEELGNSVTSNLRKAKVKTCSKLQLPESHKTMVAETPMSTIQANFKNATSTFKLPGKQDSFRFVKKSLLNKVAKESAKRDRTTTGNSSAKGRKCFPAGRRLDQQQLEQTDRESVSSQGPIENQADPFVFGMQELDAKKAEAMSRSQKQKIKATREYLQLIYRTREELAAIRQRQKALQYVMNAEA